MKKVKFVIKTKGGHKEGMGDVTSSIAMAEEMISGGHDVLFVTNKNKHVMDLVFGKGFNLTPAENLNEVEGVLARKFFDIAVLNQLDTPVSEAAIFKRHSRKLITIEDQGPGANISDMRFNVLYPVDHAETDFTFMPLNRVFQSKHTAFKTVKERVDNILVSQGGSDTYGYTPKIVKALIGIPEYVNINIVLGRHYSHDAELDAVLRLSPRSFTIVRGSHDLSDLMAVSDLAVSAGGNTLFELACLGVPTIAVCGEKFEVITADRLQMRGFGINIGHGMDVSEDDIFSAVRKMMFDFEARKKMSACGKALVDGLGAMRMVEKIIELFFSQPGGPKHDHV